MARVIYQPLLDFVEKYQKSVSKHLRSRCLRSSFQARYARMFKDLAERGFDIDLFRRVCETVGTELLADKRNSFRVVSALLQLP